MPDKVSYLKARYCRSVLRTALNSPEEDARRLVYCLATEKPTVNASSVIRAAEHEALDALAKLAQRVQDRGASAISTHWTEVNHTIELWLDAAHQEEEV